MVPPREEQDKEKKRRAMLEEKPQGTGTEPTKPNKDRVIPATPPGRSQASEPKKQRDTYHGKRDRARASKNRRSGRRNSSAEVPQTLGTRIDLPDSNARGGGGRDWVWYRGEAGSLAVKSLRNPASGCKVASFLVWMSWVCGRVGGDGARDVASVVKRSSHYKACFVPVAKFFPSTWHSNLAPSNQYLMPRRGCHSPLHAANGDGHNVRPHPVCNQTFTCTMENSVEAPFMRSR
ncbi:hypothetical protein BHE74_00000422 [Ensete ventricosum]|nr:hypothetical protein BHE74_00000422 [Ensete ventricosum]RZS01194.1 hypothetical protein BHM03_00031015 [Ensete ventricosum]